MIILIILGIIIGIIILFCNHKTTREKYGNYFHNRKGYKYYKKVNEILQKLSQHNSSILDVGGWKGEFISSVKGFPNKTVTDLHKRPKDFNKNIRFISGDFLKLNYTKYDIVVCLQVLEHLNYDLVKKFTQKLFQVGKTVIISVPYKWKSGKCKYHVHDPVDELKLFSWTNRYPKKTWIITEKNGIKRLIAVY